MYPLGEGHMCMYLHIYTHTHVYSSYAYINIYIYTHIEVMTNGFRPVLEGEPEKWRRKLV